MTKSSGGSRGRPQHVPGPGPKCSLNFMHFFGKFGKIICWCLPLTGSASEMGNNIVNDSFAHKPDGLLVVI